MKSKDGLAKPPEKLLALFKTGETSLKVGVPLNVSMALAIAAVKSTGRALYRLPKARPARRFEAERKRIP
jgi:hypothetical protein